METVKKRGGNYGGGPTVRGLTISEKAARALRYHVTGSYNGARYTAEQASAAASELIEAHADHQLMFVTPDMIAALVYLEEVRHDAPEVARRGLEQIVAALWTAHAE